MIVFKYIKLKIKNKLLINYLYTNIILNKYYFLSIFIFKYDYYLHKTIFN